MLPCGVVLVTSEKSESDKDVVFGCLCSGDVTYSTVEHCLCVFVYLLFSFMPIAYIFVTLFFPLRVVDAIQQEPGGAASNQYKTRQHLLLKGGALV